MCVCKSVSPGIDKDDEEEFPWCREEAVDTNMWLQNPTQMGSDYFIHVERRAVMPVIQTEVAIYHMNAISFEDPNKFAATLWLFDASGKSIGMWRFYADESSAAPNEFREDLGYPLISASIASFPSIVDMLRNEKPVYFTFFDYRPANVLGSIGTAREPVGEAEK